MSDNYIYIGCGYILNETANPVLSNTTYYINNTAVTGCNLKYQNENILAVYKNGAYDSNWTIGTTTPYGVKMASCPQANFDVNSTYSVDYVMLSTMHTTPTSIVTSYQTDILSAIGDLAESVNSRQKADSALDTLVDLSVYEELNNSKINQYFQWLHANGVLTIKMTLPFKVIKKCVPNITLKNIVIYKGTGGGSADVANLFTVNSMQITNEAVYVSFKTSDATTIADIKTYGVFGYFNVIADCRGRI